MLFLNKSGNANKETISFVSVPMLVDNKIVGVLGLSFKCETYEIRHSLSIKLLKLLKSKKIKTLQSDEYFKSKDNVSKNYLVKNSDIIILATPHNSYKKLKINKRKILLDIFYFFEKKKIKKFY